MIRKKIAVIITSCIVVFSILLTLTAFAPLTFKSTHTVANADIFCPNEMICDCSIPYQYTGGTLWAMSYNPNTNSCYPSYRLSGCEPYC